MIANQVAGLMSSPFAAPIGDYQSIQTVALTGSQSSISFTSIPSTYKHLQVRLIGKDGRGINRDNMKMQFNSDTGANYAWHYLSGDGSSASASGTAGDTFVSLYRISGNSGADNIFGAMVIDILDYANTSKYKTSRTLAGVDFNGSGEIYFQSGLWQNTSAVSTITFTPGNTTNFLQYSHFALYGVK